MSRSENLVKDIDWYLVILYAVLVIMGWINIYAAVYNEEHNSILDISQSYGKQMIWIITAFLIAFLVLVIDGKFYAAFSYPIYGIIMLSLIVVYLIAPEVKGARSWIEIGNFKLQPSEFAKFATNMALAKYLSALDIKLKEFKTQFIAGLILLFPIAMILLQNDTGSALVFFAFIFVLYREGLSGNFLILGLAAIILFVMALLVEQTTLFIVLSSIAGLSLIPLRKTKKNIATVAGILVLACGMVYCVDYVIENVMEPHQRTRINVLLGKETDLKGAGYNVNQSMIAIGSGGFAGKGFLQGTQTKYDFVPEQSTDFIFCTVGEEWGFIGTLVVIGLFLTLLLRIIFLAERQRSPYSRIYGYGVASILFFHLFINVGMTIGLAPVIGIPFPFFSYGGSSLWSFTVLLFIFIKLDAYRLQILR